MQAQALPVVMSGRDCIGVAKTGSGKTLAFVLPMLRHIKVCVTRCCSITPPPFFPLQAATAHDQALHDAVLL